MALAGAYRDAGRLADEQTMQQCAYQQGYGPAAYELGLQAAINGRYVEAIRIHQDGVKFGSKDCAAFLELLFADGHSPGATDQEKEGFKQLGIQVDPERESRYNAIYDSLEINPDLRLGRLDEVLPLPPAKLPSWSNVNDAAEPESDGPPTY
jgi:hypothetical protein